MTTINQLPTVVAVADTDVVLIGQSGGTHKATRAQLVSGLQQQIALGQSQLLGRSSSGSGSPEAINLGANLNLAGGVLSAATTPLNVALLPGGAPPTAGDLVPIAQGGRNVAVVMNS